MRATALLVLGLLGAACSSGAAPAEDPKSTECAGCHMAEFRAARDHEGKKPTTCGVCHALDHWHPQRVDHSFWPLTGAHVKAECSYCHHGDPPVYHGNPKECVDCHRQDFDDAKHHQRFSTACQDCHGTAAWKPTLPGVDAGSRVNDEKEEPDAEAPAPPTSAASSTPKPPPRPPPPRPRPKPSTTPTSTPPDTVTGGSRRVRQ